MPALKDHVVRQQQLRLAKLKEQVRKLESRIGTPSPGNKVLLLSAHLLRSSREYDFSECTKDTTHQSLVFEEEDASGRTKRYCSTVISVEDLYKLLDAAGHLHQKEVRYA